jgi:hypothetical protein
MPDDRDCLICGAPAVDLAAEAYGCPCVEDDFDAFEEDHCLALILWWEDVTGRIEHEGGQRSLDGKRARKLHSV